MSEVKKSLNFIEQIMEEDLKSNYNQHELKFRFPPEPNGYLHIGHAKSICLNFGLGEKYGAPVNLRFDDTNPIKEEQEFVDSIKEDILWLGFKWEKECYASDYFQQLYDWAVEMIKNGDAYVDSQTSELIAEQKGTPTKPVVISPFSNRSAGENLDLFEKMKNGEAAEGAHVLRARIDMASSNMLMRDPVMYRSLHKKHHRTGNDWLIYPMYDWAHGQSDFIEQVSHSFCTLEFVMHRELYNWFLEKIDTKDQLIPKQREFARLNLSYTIMSKRKLAQLVTNSIVSSWDDPRMPTISGLRRRGYTPAAIRKFAETIGVAKRDNVINVSLLEFCIREDLNKTAPRVMGVLDPVKLVITNYDDEKGEILEIHCTFDPKSKSGSGTEESLKKVKGTLHWVSIAHAIKAEIRLYDRLFSIESPDADKEKDFMEFINPDSLKVITGFVEPGLKYAGVSEKFQFQRIGYFCVDKESTEEHLVFNRTVNLRDSWVK